MPGTELQQPLPITDETYSGDVKSFVFCMLPRISCLWWLGTLLRQESVVLTRRKEKKTVRTQALVISAMNLGNVPLPVGIGKVDSLKCTLNGEQKPNVAKFIKMLKT